MFQMCQLISTLPCLVSARLRSPQDGLFTGVIDALDTVHNTYCTTFDHPGLGTHSIPDCEVLSQVNFTEVLITKWVTWDNISQAVTRRFVGTVFKPFPAIFDQIS